MPELPEVETMVRGIRPLVEGRQLLSLRRCPCACRPLSITPSLRTLAARLRGKTARSVRRRGKRIVIEFDAGLVLAVEPRMTGLILAADPPDREHLRLQWTFSERSAGDVAAEVSVQGNCNTPATSDQAGPTSIWFWDRRGLGTVTLYTQEEYQAIVEDGRLGPDALELNAAGWKALLNSTSRPVKIVLLDQKLVAGIGNLYASEILHLAAIDPCRLASSLSGEEAHRLARSVRKVLKDAIRDEGSTLSDATYRTVLSEPGRYQNRHQVYAREGEPCYRCGTGSAVERIVQQQRSTFFCRQCQRVGET